MMNITVRVQAARAKREIEYLRAQVRTLEAALGKAGSTGGSMFNGGLAGLSRWGSGMQWAGRQLSANFTLPVVAAGTAVTKWALDNERAMVQVAKVYGDARTGAALFKRDADALAQAFELLSVRYATQQQQVREIAADWAAAGASGAALARGTEATLKTMVLGQMEAAEATEALISIQAQWGADTERLLQIIDMMNATENATGITFQGLVQGMQRSSSVARTAGVDVEYLLAMLSALTPATGSATQSGNALKTMISRLLSPTKDAAQVLGLMGLNMDDINWKSLDGAQRLELLARRYHELEGAADGYTSSQAAVVSSVVASRYQINRFDQLMRDIYASIDKNAETNGYYDRTLDVLSNQNDVAATAIRELNTVLESNPMVAQRAGVVIQNSLMKSIQNVLPQIMWLINLVASMTEKFANLDPFIQKSVLAFLGLLAVLGPPLVIFGSLAVAVARVGMVFQTLSGPLAAVRGWFKKSEDGPRTYGVTLSGLVGRVKTAMAQIVTTISGSTPAATAAAAAQGAGIATGLSSSIAAAAPSAAAAGASTAAAATAGAAATTAATTPTLVGAFRNAWRSAVALTTAEIAAMNAAASINAARSAIATRTAVASAVGNAQALSARVSAALSGLVARTKVAWANMNATVATQSTLITAKATEGATKVAAAVDRGWVSANSRMYIGLERMQGMMYGAYGSFQRATQRTFMENLGVINSYVTASIAAASRMGAGVTAAAQTASSAAMAATAGARTAVTGAAAGVGATASVAAASWSAKFMAALKGLGPRIITFFKSLGPALLAILKTIGPKILAFLTGPWGIAIGIITTLLLAFKDQLGQLFSNIGRMAQDSTSPFGKAWAGVVNLFNKGVEVANKAFQALPEGVQGALRAVVTLVKNAAMKVYEWFSYINPFARHSPSLVENVTNGMAIVGERFGLAARVIKGHMTSAYQTITKFGSAVAGFMSQVQKMSAAEERAKVVKFTPGATKFYDELNRLLPPLRSDLEAVSMAMAKQEGIVNRLRGAVESQQRAVDALQDTYDTLQGKLDSIQTQMDSAEQKMREFTDTGITGQRAMSDAIFANEMAQKKLRLEILRLEQAGGSVEDLQSGLASLQGDIEELRGKASDLRSAGAGSDILGPINAEIAAMEAQYRALQSGASTGGDTISEMQKQLEELQKQGEILDLENAIQFDPLTRQIEQLTDGYKELPFNSIVAGIKSQQTELKKLQPQYDAANRALDAQKVKLDAAKTELDRANDSYNAQKAILDGLQTTYSAVEDQIRAVEDAISSVTGAADDMQRSLDEAARKAKEASEYLSPGAQNFLDAAGGSFEDPGGFNTISDESGDINDWIDEFLANSGTIFDDLDLFGPIREKWEAFKTWWATNVNPIFTNLWQGLVDAASGIDWGAPFRAVGDFFAGIWQNITDGFSMFFGGDSQVGTALSDWWDRVSGPLKDAWESIKAAWDDAYEQIKPALDELGRALGEAWEAIKGAWDELYPTLKAAWEKAKPIFDTIGKVIGVAFGIIAGIIGGLIIVISNLIANVIGPVISIITTIITTVIGVVTGIIDFLVGVFTGDWQKAWDGIVGIFSSIWDGIVGIFQGAWDLVVGIVTGLVDGVVSWFNWLYDILVGHSIVPDMVNAIIDWFVSLKDKAIQWVKKLWDGVVTWFTNLKNDAVQRVVDLKTNAINKFNEIKDGIIQKVKDIWNGVVTWFNTTKEDVVQKVIDLKTSAVNKFNEIKENLIQKAKDIRDKVLEPINTLKENFLEAFRTVRDNISGIFTTIKEKVQQGMNGPIRAINKLIDGLNKVADVLPGIDWHISTIPLFASGGVLPKRVGGGFATTGARAIVGEGNPAHPEYVIPTDPAYRGRALDLLRSLQTQLGVPTDDPGAAIGGPISTITNWLGGASALIDAGTDWMQNVAAGAVSTVFSPFKKLIDDQVAKISWDLGRHMVQAGVDKVLGWIDNADQSFQDIEKTISGTWRKPMDHYSITSRYGPRSMFGNSFHAGIDLANGGGSTIKAASGGTVVRRGFNAVTGRSGLAVVLQHANDIFSYYGHMASVVAKMGQIVKPGQKLGIEGATGNVTGPHLHFEIHKGRIGGAVNPEPFMRGKGIPLADGGIVRARSGGTLATIGEAGRDEAVIPLPTGWKNIFNSIRGVENVTRGMTVQYMTVLGSIEAREIVVPLTQNEYNSYNFYGNLEFPNVKNGSDAKEFIQNLEDLAGSR